MNPPDHCSRLPYAAHDVKFACVVAGDVDMWAGHRSGGSDVHMEGPDAVATATSVPRQAGGSGDDRAPLTGVNGSFPAPAPRKRQRKPDMSKRAHEIEPEPTPVRCVTQAPRLPEVIQPSENGMPMTSSLHDM